jgi:hypothetical protein
MIVEVTFACDVACYVTISIVIYVIQPLLAGKRNQEDQDGTNVMFFDIIHRPVFI